MPAPNELLAQDLNDLLLYVMDWTAWLPTAVILNTSTWTITGPDSALVKDQESILSGNTKTQLRLSAGTGGATYKVTNRITTNESPAQTKELSFFVKVRDE